MEPHAVLGVSADADEEAIAAAYRKLAKRFHPDARPGRRGRRAAGWPRSTSPTRCCATAQAEMHARTAPGRRPRRRRTAAAGQRRARRASWPAALEAGEEVVVVTDAATWDSFRVRLAVTDRRLLWLRADAPTDRDPLPALERDRVRRRPPASGRGGGSASCWCSRATGAGCPSPSSTRRRCASSCWPRSGTCDRRSPTSQAAAGRLEGVAIARRVVRTLGDARG